MKRPFISYIVLLHLFIVVVLWKSDFLDRVHRRLWDTTPVVQPEFTSYFDRILNYHSRSVGIVPDEAVIFIGDSITQGLCVSAVAPVSVNFGIGSDTTLGVLKRLPVYMPALERAKYIVLAIGINDFRYRTAVDAVVNYEQILDELPKDRRIVVSAILPMNESARPALAERVEWVKEFNAGIKKLTSKRELVTFLDSQQSLDSDSDGQLDPQLHSGDGVHLNSAGNRLWAMSLQSAID